MATGVINRRPDDIVRPTCSKFSCLTTFEIPYRDRMLARYCPEHDQSGYWASKRPQTFHDIPNRENVARVKYQGKWHWIEQISLSGRRLMIKRGRAKAFPISANEIEDVAGLG